MSPLERRRRRAESDARVDLYALVLDALEARAGEPATLRAGMRIVLDEADDIEEAREMVRIGGVDDSQ